VAEDFKLTTGTWVSVGTLRVRLISTLAPLVQDAVITGHERDEVGALLFPSPQARELDRAELHRRVRQALREWREQEGGSSHCPVCALFLDEPPSVDAGEITDKGYINQRAVRHRRAEQVLALHAQPAGEGVIRV
jgi:feruloyl-CoA synthase